MKILSTIFIGVLAISVVAGYQDTDLRTLLNELKQRADSRDAAAIDTNKRDNEGNEKRFISVSHSQACFSDLNTYRKPGICPTRRSEDIQQLGMQGALAFLKREMVKRDLFHECCVETCDTEEIKETC
ncbi:uncharacterized protein [Amphiura filiformis]|uniref:uncharacterized protein n=1 Tax=Amphiura filiformis TaxID=82378 RepID=UPI003B228A72